jgi:predicted phosphodiesterase
MAGRTGDRAWTGAEVATAKAMRGKHTDREIGEAINRTACAVRNMWKRLERTPRENVRGRPVKVPAASPGVASRLGVGEKQPTIKPKQVDSSSPALEPILIVSDAHRPYHSKVWWDLLMQVGRALKPKHLVIIGDFADFYSVSDHDKAPERANRMDAELADVDQGLDELDSLGATDKLYIEGNHEDRLRRHLMKNPALARVVSTEKLLKLKERGWEFVPYKRHASRGAVHFTHDVGASGRNAVFRALDTYQTSVVFGHTHRLQVVVEGTAVGGCKLSASFGWGGDVEAVDYMNLARARASWALGFGVGYLEPTSGFCYLQAIPVIGGTVCVNGRIFRAA